MRKIFTLVLMAMMAISMSAQTTSESKSAANTTTTTDSDSMLEQLKSKLDEAKSFYAIMRDGEEKTRLGKIIDIADYTYNHYTIDENISTIIDSLTQILDEVKGAAGVTEVTVSSQSKNGKFIQNGKVVILHEGKTFSADGALLK